MKPRVIPTILTNGATVIKGEEFNNWRTVGYAQAMANIFAIRDVDELMFLDVCATFNRSVIDPLLIEQFSLILNTPFSVGGGIDSVEKAITCLRLGAEKVVLGTAAVQNPNLISQIADMFGTQAVVVSVDVDEKSDNTILTHSGKQSTNLNFLEFAVLAERSGAGEILLQSQNRDGKMVGYFLDGISQLRDAVSVPIIASSGAGSPNDFLDGIKAGASAVAGGAIFQFTENTPKSVSQFLSENGVAIRNA